MCIVILRRVAQRWCDKLACVQSITASPQQVADLLGRLAVLINRTSAPLLFRTLGELGLSFTQVKALHVLEDSGEVSVKDVAAALNLSLPAASRALDGLTRRGYVDRKESEIDRRSKLVRLLPAGQEALEAIARGRLEALTEWAATLSDDERAGLHAVLLPILERTPSQ
jgi:DNA-binding MarR family transcriptional regulator